MLSIVGIMMPAIGKVRANAKVSSARADVATLTTALAQVENTYSNFRKMTKVLEDASACETKDTSSDKYSVINSEDGYKLFFNNIIDPKSITDNDKLFNNRKIKMLDSRKHKDDQANEFYGWLDPWGSRYNIYWDSDNDEKIVLNGDDYFKTVLIVSAGEDKTFGTDDDIMLDQ